MRKGIVLLLVLLVLFFAFVYWIIPNNISVQQKARIVVNAKAFTRLFLHEEAGRAWTDNNDTAANHFVYNGNSFTLVERRLASKIFSISNGQDSMLAEVVAIPFTTDTVEVHFAGVKKAGLNPGARIHDYNWAKTVGNDLKSLLQKLQSFYADDKNIYGFHIKKELVDDSTLISTFVKSKDYPTTDAVYNLFTQLRTYAEKNAAQPTDHPMLNITQVEDSGYLTRVALPVNKRLNNEGNIQAKWMMGRGNILVTELKGGPAQINNAFAAMNTYAIDHQWTTAAIPFQSLITDRKAEPDTAKWVTKLYWPVM